MGPVVADRGDDSESLEAWSDLKGSYDFNSNPIAPAGTKVMIHEDASIRSTWDPHGVRGYYLGPAMEH
jgi:hypothetical protein